MLVTVISCFFSNDKTNNTNLHHEDSTKKITAQLHDRCVDSRIKKASKKVTQMTPEDMEAMVDVLINNQLCLNDQLVALEDSLKKYNIDYKEHSFIVDILKSYAFNETMLYVRFGGLTQDIKKKMQTHFATKSVKYVQQRENPASEQERIVAKRKLIFI